MDAEPGPDGPVPAAAPAPAIGLAEATRFWLKLGFISFGGPAGQIAIMHRELVDERRWISEGRFLHALSFCMVLPGPEAQQLATYIGWLLHRTWGGIIAGGLFVLPSLAILIALSWIYVAFGTLPAVAGAFAAVKPAVVAIIVHAVHRIGSRALTTPTAWSVAGLSFAGMILGVPFPIIIGVAALAGIVIGRLLPDQLRAGRRHGAKGASAAPALLDDDTPTPAHARFHAGRLAGVIATGLGLWATPLAWLASAHGEATLARMAWFFTKAALLTFGGAYAVLPYVVQGAVHEHGWLTAAQMIDGLALGETTPGPLIMVVTFVGFVGGHAQALFGPDRAWLAGVAAAVVVSWFTFLPSFVFVLAGGPIVESARDDVTFVAPLSAITAAVVGVILHLAVFFGGHVFWPAGLAGPFDLRALLIALAASVALFRFTRHVIEVIVVCAVFGALTAWW
ncbi:MAG: chromate efflux transporter [Vicinamibacteraceae bacterium]